MSVVHKRPELFYETEARRFGSLRRDFRSSLVPPLPSNAADSLISTRPLSSESLVALHPHFCSNPPSSLDRVCSWLNRTSPL
jgi:hypothetical protein